MNPSQIDKLIQKLDVQGDKAAEKIILQLTKIGSSAVPALIIATKDETEPRIRKWSLQALGSIGDKRSANILIKS